MMRSNARLMVLRARISGTTLRANSLSDVSLLLYLSGVKMRGERGNLTQLRPHQQRRPHRDGVQNS